MTNVVKRIFKKGQVLYVVDCWGTTCGTEFFEAYAKIVEVNEEEESFIAVLYGDTCQKYNFNDYGRIIFDNEFEARNVADKLPKPKSNVYQIIGKRVFRKIVVDATDRVINGFTDLVLRLNKGKEIPIGKIGLELFLDEQSAREKLQTM